MSDFCFGVSVYASWSPHRHSKHNRDLSTWPVREKKTDYGERERESGWWNGARNYVFYPILSAWRFIVMLNTVHVVLQRRAFCPFSVDLPNIMKNRCFLYGYVPSNTYYCAGFMGGPRERNTTNRGLYSNYYVIYYIAFTEKTTKRETFPAVISARKLHLVIRTR